MADENEGEVTEELSVEDLALEEEESSPDNILDMSDEDFANSMMEDFIEPGNEETDTASEEESASADSEEEEETTEEEDSTEESDDDETEETTDDDQEDTTDEEEDTSDEESESEEEVDDETELSSDDIVKEIFSPFKANGKEMQVESIDDVRQLMQMGANYNKKMAALKPNLRLMKMLQNNDLLDEGKLSYLIDLDKKNPDAIKKLISDSKIDIDDLDNETEVAYKPNTYTVNDKEVELDDTLNDIKDTDSYARTLEVISNKWDESSRALILQNPAAIRTINDHISSGVYDKITAAVESERMFGRIPNSMSDLEAYKQVGDAINAKGGLKQAAERKLESRRVRSKAGSKTVDPKLSERKKAASSTKGRSSGKAKEQYNPLSMSDEDFEKMSMENFI